VELLMKDITKHETQGLGPAAVKNYAKHLPQFIALKASRVRGFSTHPCREPSLHTLVDRGFTTLLHTLVDRGFTTLLHTLVEKLVL